MSSTMNERRSLRPGFLLLLLLRLILPLLIGVDYCIWFVVTFRYAGEIKSSWLSFFFLSQHSCTLENETESIAINDCDNSCAEGDANCVQNCKLVDLEVQKCCPGYYRPPSNLYACEGLFESCPSFQSDDFCFICNRC